MRAATGRLLFFDRLAEGMQTSLIGGVPPRIALHTRAPGATVPDIDLKSLARALCRYHVPASEDIPEFKWSTHPAAQLQAAIFNVEGRKLGECVSRIRSEQFTRFFGCDQFCGRCR
jgi:hypothetical protein